jgi:hypothetical protein
VSTHPSPPILTSLGRGSAILEFSRWAATPWTPHPSAQAPPLWGRWRVNPWLPTPAVFLFFIFIFPIYCLVVLLTNR